MQIETDHREQHTTGQPTWLAPVVVMRAILDMILHLLGLHARLKRLRSTASFPASWRDHWQDLRAQEWNRHRMRAHAAAALLAGREPDFSDWQFATDIPEDFGQCPKSAWQMHRRFVTLARFGAEFEADILRHTHRIANREQSLSKDPLRRAACATSPSRAATEGGKTPALCLHQLQRNWGRWHSAQPNDGGGLSAQRARAPPTTPLLTTRYSLLTSLATPARTLIRA